MKIHLLILQLSKFIKGSSDTGLGREYRKVDNILNITDISETYLIQETTDERYELLFGDGVFGKKLKMMQLLLFLISLTDGVEGNEDPSAFTYAGSVVSSTNQISLPSITPTITTVSAYSANGGSIESIDSIKYLHLDSILHSTKLQLQQGIMSQ